MFTYSLLNVLNEQVNSTSIDFKRKVASFLEISDDELEEMIRHTLRLIGACGEIGQVVGAFLGDSGKTFGRLVGECVGLILSVGYVVYKIIFKTNPNGDIEAVALPV